jgi:uncharacterized protein
MKMLKRTGLVGEIGKRLGRQRVVGLVGMRQTGKTTLAREFAKTVSGPSEFFDLERPRDAARLADPMLTLEPLRGLVIIDEIQHVPGLFPVLRVLADRPRTPARFLVLGSAAPEMLRQSSESLAGRISYIHVCGFSLSEVGLENQQRLWLRGSLPRSFLAKSNHASSEWRDDFVSTFTRRDIPELGIATPPATLRRFWTMLAHYHAQTWNASEFARAFGMSVNSIRRYLDQLTSAFAVRQLQPWLANLKKRQVRSPKVYLSDSGVLHSLLGLRQIRDLESHPKVGASWEGFLLEQIVNHVGAKSDECFFWGTHGGAELDLLIVRGSRRLAFEFKRSSAPRATASMHSALADLKLDRIDVMYPGADVFPLAKKIRAVGADCLFEAIKPLV